MILRRLTKHVKDQNWFAVALDFVIVVSGILIAFQITSWNEARQERMREQAYIERMAADMANSLEDRRADAGWDAERLRTQQVVLRSLRSGELAPEDRVDFDTGLLLFGYVTEPRVRWETVEELASTGGTTVIRDLALRDALGRMQSEITRRRSLANSLTGSINSLREKVANRYEVVDFDFASERASTLRHDFSVLAEDREFLNLLSQIDYYARTKVSNSDYLSTSVETLWLELEQRRAPRSDPTP